MLVFLQYIGTLVVCVSVTLYCVILFGLVVARSVPSSYSCRLVTVCLSHPQRLVCCSVLIHVSQIYIDRARLAGNKQLLLSALVLFFLSVKFKSAILSTNCEDRSVCL